MNKTLVISSTIYPESKKQLREMGYNLIELNSYNILESPVSSHPDMFMTQFDNAVLIDNTVNSTFINFNTNENVIFCNRGVEQTKILEYPENIGFNCVKVGDKLICNKKHTCKSVLEYASENGVQILDVKQGYAKCSTCVVSDRAIITEDESIAKCAALNGIDVLKIRKGHVLISKYDYGFIGGCCGLIEKNLLAFNGNVFVHPDSAEISEFCYKYSVSLCDRELYDIGSIFRLR